MDKTYDVVALGELLIDFTETGNSPQGNPLLEVNPGGAPGNVLSMLQNYGEKTAFIGKVGNDMFGRILLDAVGSCGIDTKGILVDQEVHTTLAFVHTYEDGDRDFSFYRNPGADMMLKKQEINEDLPKAARILHFGTLSMTHADAREATVYAVSEAKRAGALISFDPNLREPLWDSMEEAKEQVLTGLGYCDILKISDNEIQWLTGKEDFIEGIEWIYDRYEIPLITLSMGKSGSMAFYKKDPSAKEYIKAEVKPFLQKDTIETTGAGDTFGGCILHFVLEKGLKDLNEADLKKMLTFANGAASIITTRRGALKVMPEPEEVRQLINKNI